MMRRNLSPPQCNRVNQCFLPCLDEEKLITKCEIKYLMKSLCHNSTFQTTYYPHVNRNLSLERNSPWLICNLDCFMSFRKKNSDFITIIFHTFLPDIFYKLKDENNAYPSDLQERKSKVSLIFPWGCRLIRKKKEIAQSNNVGP